MKKLFIMFAVLGFSVSAMSHEIYFLAPETRIESVQNIGTSKAEVKLSYHLPCWAEKVDTIQKAVILGSRFNPAARFEIVLGVLLKGDNMSPCLHFEEVFEEVEETLSVSTFPPEGGFMGFKLIDNQL